MVFFFFFNDTATPEIYTLSDTLSLHDALPICRAGGARDRVARRPAGARAPRHREIGRAPSELQSPLNISYAVFCLKKKKKKHKNKNNKRNRTIKNKNRIKNL